MRLQFPHGFPWFTDATQHGLVEAGKEYLRHLLSQQLALYRVVTRTLIASLNLGCDIKRMWSPAGQRFSPSIRDEPRESNKWIVTSGQRAGVVYEALLRADLFESGLHGIRFPE